jgi:ribosomal RNA assembly protein
LVVAVHKKMKSGRYSEPLKKPNLVAKFEREDEKRREEKSKKEWIEGGQFTKQDNPFSFQETSSFTVLFPQYREPYFKSNWNEIQQIFKQHELSGEIDLYKGNFTVSTTNSTFDPYIIIKGRDFLQLLARGISIEQAKRVLQDNIYNEIIKISSYVRKKETFIKRRERLIGPDGSTLKAIELLTGCYILIQGKTVSVIGTVSGIRDARKVIIDCMQNIHPIYNIKELMVKKELAKNEKLKNENWDKYLPKFKKNKPLKKKTKKTKKKPYSPFPPEAEKSKKDLEIESGVYFLNAEQKKEIEKTETKKKQSEKVKENAKLRDEIFIAPKEKEGGKKKLKELKELKKEQEPVDEKKSDKKRKRTEEKNFTKNKKF